MIPPKVFPLYDVSCQPHGNQFEGIFAVVDGCDLIPIRAIGTRETGFFFMLIPVMRAISEDNALALGGRIFPKDHGMIVACPKKALQEDMVCRTCQFVSAIHGRNIGSMLESPCLARVLGDLK